MDENVRWQRRILIERAVIALKRNGFETASFECRDEAVAFLLDQAASVETVGFGGSMTLGELDLPAQVERLGKRALVHGRPGLTSPERRAVMQQQLQCDLFFCSTNALTLDGILVNIDATGNRVCSMVFGPKKVWVVAGANKIVKDVPAALQRVREVSSPPNAKRLGYRTPCAVTGICSDCDAPDRICRVTTIIERKPRMTEFGVCLINETLGY